MSADPIEFIKAQELIKEKKISKLKDKSIDLVDHFLVTGTKNEKYLTILPDFCTCMHFHINCIKEKGSICKHILACRLAGEKTPEVEIDNWQSLIFDDFYEGD